MIRCHMLHIERLTEAKRQKPGLLCSANLRSPWNYYQPGSHVEARGPMRAPPLPEHFNYTPRQHHAGVLPSSPVSPLSFILSIYHYINMILQTVGSKCIFPISAVQQNNPSQRTTFNGCHQLQALEKQSKCQQLSATVRPSRETRGRAGVI